MVLLAVVVRSIEVTVEDGEGDGDGEVSIWEITFEFGNAVDVENNSLDAVICDWLSTDCSFSVVETEFTEQGEVTCECELEGEELSPSLPLVFCSKDTIVDDRLRSNTF